MNKSLKKTFLCIFMALAMVFVTAAGAFGADLNKMLKETEGLEDYLKDLTKTLAKVSLKQEYIQTEIDNAVIKLDENQSLLNDAEEACSEQYSLMKKRIKFLYESNNTNYLEALLSASSISDALNRIEYIDKIVGYDRDMLQKYTELVQTITDLKEQLTEKKAALDELQIKSLENDNVTASVSEFSKEDLKAIGVNEEDVEDLIDQYIAEYGDGIREEIEQEISDRMEEDPDYDWYEEIMTDEEPTEEVISSEEPAPADPEPEPQTEEQVPPTTPEPDTLPTEPETTTTRAPQEYPTNNVDEGEISDLGYSDFYLVACILSAEVGYMDYDYQMWLADIVWRQPLNPYMPDTIWECLHWSDNFLAVNWWYIPGTNVPSYKYYIKYGPLDLSMQVAYDAYNAVYNGTGQDYYEEPDYEDTGYDDTGYDDTGYDDTGYDDTGYDDTGYDDTGADPAVTEDPVSENPGGDDASYDEGSEEGIPDYSAYYDDEASDEDYYYYDAEE